MFLMIISFFLLLSACINCESCREWSIGPSQNLSTTLTVSCKSDQSENPEPAWSTDAVSQTELHSPPYRLFLVWPSAALMLSSMFWC